MSRFKELYDFCQTLSIKVSRKQVIPKTLEIFGLNKIQSTKTTMDTTVTRGMFLSVADNDNPLVKLFGCNVIAIAREQSYCWERFVNIKELMHLFDDEEQSADTVEKFDELLSGFQSSYSTEPVVYSEKIAYWRALACLCPEKDRLTFKQQLLNNETDHYAIALKLRIPVQVVPNLFIEQYEQILRLMHK